jgi:hypothetical protein
MCISHLRGLAEHARGLRAQVLISTSVTVVSPLEATVKSDIEKRPTM